ncbi:MAG: hydrolase [Acidimicrobiales bacterium]
MAIDTSVFASGAKTAAGGIRNSRAFWRGWGDTYGDTLSAANRSFIDEGLSPVVDDVWLRTFPEHGSYLGETLVHHHLGRGPMAIPLPQPVHGNVPGYGIWHGF